MSNNRIRTVSLMQMDIHHGLMPIHQLAVQLAESLKSLTALDSAGLDETVTEIQELLPPNIRVERANGNFQISIAYETTVSSGVNQRTVGNRMSLQNIVNEEPYPALPKDDDLDDVPVTPTGYHDFVEALSNESHSDAFESVNWPSWLDDDFQ